MFPFIQIYPIGGSFTFSIQMLVNYLAQKLNTFPWIKMNNRDQHLYPEGYCFIGTLKESILGNLGPSKIRIVFCKKKKKNNNRNEFVYETGLLKSPINIFVNTMNHFVGVLLNITI